VKKRKWLGVVSYSNLSLHWRKKGGKKGESEKTARFAFWGHSVSCLPLMEKEGKKKGKGEKRNRLRPPVRRYKYLPHSKRSDKRKEGKASAFHECNSLINSLYCRGKRRGGKGFAGCGSCSAKERGGGKKRGGKRNRTRDKAKLSPCPNNNPRFSRATRGQQGEGKKKRRNNTFPVVDLDGGHLNFP